MKSPSKGSSNYKSSRVSGRDFFVAQFLLICCAFLDQGIHTNMQYFDRIIRIHLIHIYIYTTFYGIYPC